MLIIGISGKHGQGKSRTAVAIAAQLKRCTIISVYDIVKFYNNYQSIEERNAIVSQIREVREDYLIDSLKIRIALASSLYDTFIIDDIFDSILMNQIKRELNAQIVGVEKPELHKLPLIIRDNIAAGVIGEPDYILRFSANYNELLKEVNKLLEALKAKGLTV